MAKAAQTKDNEFAENSEEVEDVPSELNDSGDEGEELDHESLMAMGFDNEADERDHAAIHPPGGDWKKEGRFERSEIFVGADRQPGDISPQGRHVVIFSGKPQERDIGDVTHQPTLYFRVSRDERFKRDEPTKPDIQRRLFLSAKELYLKKNGKQPSNIGELFEMLEEDDYTINTMQGEQGLVVLGFKQTRN